MITLKRTGFLWRIIGLIYGIDVSKSFVNFCPLFWLTVATVFIWPMVLILRLGQKMVSSLNEKKEREEVRTAKRPMCTVPKRGKGPLVTTAIVAGRIIVRILETFLFFILTLLFILGVQSILVTNQEITILSIIIGIILVLVVFVLILVKTTPVVCEFIYNIYKRNCPLINWKGEKK